MAGYDRGMLQQTKDFAAQLGLLDAVSFPGYISNEQKNRFARELDIYICTNKIDNAPISIIEMMALGMPIVTVDSGGIPFLVQHGHDCLMVRSGDSHAMAEKIVYLMNHPDVVQELAENARKSAKRFGEEAVMEKWEALFKQLSN